MSLPAIQLLRIVIADRQRCFYKVDVMVDGLRGEAQIHMVASSSWEPISTRPLGWLSSNLAALVTNKFGSARQRGGEQHAEAQAWQRELARAIGGEVLEAEEHALAVEALEESTEEETASTLFVIFHAKDCDVVMTVASGCMVFGRAADPVSLSHPRSHYRVKTWKNSGAAYRAINKLRAECEELEHASYEVVSIVQYAARLQAAQQRIEASEQALRATRKAVRS